ncbi:hypothetical protein HYU96_03165 [Candidatus Daviesbacteria bacterium]|nr:hypothetical protein [Candidatus Daviesbacteria bacterium]
MIRRLKLTPAKLKIFASASSNIGQAIILFSFAAFFFPEVVSLPINFPKEFAFLTFVGGLLLIIGAAIINPEDK